MIVEADLTTANPTASNNVFKSLIDLSVGYYPQGGTLYASSIITSVMLYSQTCKMLPVFFFHLPACFFIYTCVISHKFVLASLRKTCVFFLWFLMGSPFLLFLSQPRSKGCFILRQMTLLRLMLVCSFINFVIPLPATYIRHSRDN